MDTWSVLNEANEGSVRAKQGTDGHPAVFPARSGEAGANLSTFRAHSRAYEHLPGASQITFDCSCSPPKRLPDGMCRLMKATPLIAANLVPTAFQPLHRRHRFQMLQRGCSREEAEQPETAGAGDAELDVIPTGRGFDVMRHAVRDVITRAPSRMPPLSSIRLDRTRARVIRCAQAQHNIAALYSRPVHRAGTAS